jgi:hypothetical protein
LPCSWLPGASYAGELLGLRCRDVDLLHGTLTVAATRVRTMGGTMVDKTPKSEAGMRTVAIPAHVLVELGQHLDHHVASEADALVLPLVTIPLAAADNDLNAARIEQLGAGVTVYERDRSATTIGTAIRAVLGDPSYRDTARRVAAEIAMLPPLTDAVPLVERLATERGPLLSSV